MMMLRLRRRGLSRRRGGWYVLLLVVLCFLSIFTFIALSTSSFPARETQEPPLFKVVAPSAIMKRIVINLTTTTTTAVNNDLVNEVTCPTLPPRVEQPSISKVQEVHFDWRIHTNTSIVLPNIFNFLPHLAQHTDQLDPVRPENITRRSREKPRIVFGIPTVRRVSHFYLLKTLNSLLSGLSQQEKDRIVLIIYIGETNGEHVKQVMNNVRHDFQKEMEEGLIEVIAPPPFYYPELDNLPSTFGDTKARVKWRAKQNLDYAYLMMYAQNKAEYYVQLEDDVIAAPGYIGKIEAFVRNRNPNWFMLEFCRLGFIGKMFHAKDLFMLIEFFLIFYKQKPNDWLLDHYIEVRVCSPEKGRKECNLEKNKIRITSKPSLFQHVGKESSLKGKTQKLVDKGFLQNKQQRIKENQFVPHPNPKAEVVTNCIEYSRFYLQPAYEGKNFAWIKTPKNSSLISFRFEKPVLVKSFLFQTGNHDHPGDILKFGVVEVLTSDKYKKIIENAKELKVDTGVSTVPAKEYVIVGVFNEKGLVEGKITASLGKIVELRIRVTLDVTDNWVIFSEFLIS